MSCLRHSGTTPGTVPNQDTVIYGTQLEDSQRPSQQGLDIFLLAKTTEGWKIAAITNELVAPGVPFCVNSNPNPIPGEMALTVCRSSVRPRATAAASLPKFRYPRADLSSLLQFPVPVGIKNCLTYANPIQSASATQMCAKPTAALILCIQLALLGTELSAARLVLNVIDEDGNRVSSLEAQLLLFVWGDTHRADLQTSDGRVMIDLSPDDLKRQWPDQVAPNPVWGRLLLQAPCCAGLISEPFEMFAEGSNLTGPRSISFPRHDPVTFDLADTRNVDIVMRHARRRYLRLLTPSDAPIASEKVSISLFWSNSNHCGVPFGAEFLAGEVSDAEGLVPVPDGEFDYLFQFTTLQRGHIVGNDDSDNLSKHLITRLNEDISPIHIKYWDVQELNLTFLLDDKPLVGRRLTASMRGCNCGACGGLIAETDQSGKAQMSGTFSGERPFYPEELGELALDNIWKFDPLRLHYSRENVVHLRASPLGLDELWRAIQRFGSPAWVSRESHSVDSVPAPVRNRRSVRYDQPGLHSLLSKKDPFTTLVGGHASVDLDPVREVLADTAVLATVTSATSYFSGDKSAIYSEHNLQLDQVLYRRDDLPLRAGSTLTGSRIGGSMWIDDLTVATFRVDGLGFPRVGEQYILFLEWNPDLGDFTILRAFWEDSGVIVPVDSDPEMPYAGMEKSEFLWLIFGNMRPGNGYTGLFSR